MSPVASLYNILKPADGEAPRYRGIIAALVALACVLVGVGVVRVTRQQETQRLGFELSRRADHLRQLEETRRALELERATLTTPARIRRLATQLGMTTVPPEKIRVVTVKK